MTPEGSESVVEVTATEGDLTGEEVTAAVETAGSVDLTTVSQQLDQVINWQVAQFGTQWIFIGCFVGAVVALIIRRFWR